MSQDQGGYPHYVEGMIIPEGVFPPMEGYTHEALIDASCGKAYEYLIAHNIDETLARETVFGIAAYINSKFEEKLVEYDISVRFNQVYENLEQRKESIERMAKSYSTLVLSPIRRSLDGSPILRMGRAFCLDLAMVVVDDIREHILTLNNVSPS